MVPAYPNLAAAIAKRDIKRKAIARKLKITDRTFYGRMYGKTEFSFSEANIIHHEFFSDMDKETLFKRADEIE